MKGTDRYRVEGLSCRLGDDTLRVVNLSVGGLFLESGTPPPAGQSVSLRLLRPEGDEPQLVGVVTWINEAARPRVKALPPGFGVKIVRMAFTDKMALLAILREKDPGALRRS